MPLCHAVQATEVPVPKSLGRQRGRPDLVLRSGRGGERRERAEQQREGGKTEQPGTAAPGRGSGRDGEEPVEETGLRAPSRRRAHVMPLGRQAIAVKPASPATGPEPRDGLSPAGIPEPLPAAADHLPSNTRNIADPSRQSSGRNPDAFLFLFASPERARRRPARQAVRRRNVRVTID